MRNVYSLIILLFVCFGLYSCGSAEFIPTKDICSVVKHPNDNLYQVKINGQKISDRWYLKNDALDITKMLAAQNKCMR